MSKIEAPKLRYSLIYLDMKQPKVELKLIKRFNIKYEIVVYRQR